MLAQTPTPLFLDPRARREVLFRIHSALRSADNLRPDEAFDELVELYEVWVREGALSERAIEEHRPKVRASRAALVRVIPQLAGLLGDRSQVVGPDLFQELADVGVRSGLGQYFTPSPAAEAMAAYLAPKAGESWLDPFCGSGLLLGEVAKTATGPVELFGTDLDPRVLRLASIEGELRHPDSPLCVARVSALSSPEEVLEAVGASAEGVDGVVTNPPFGAVDLRGEGERQNFELATNGATPIELLGLEQSLRLLRPGGRMGIVLPQSVFSNKRMEHVRTFLTTQFKVDAVLSLPPETFALFQGVGKASILFATKEENATGRVVWFGLPRSAGWDATGREGAPEDIVETALAMRSRTTVIGKCIGHDKGDVLRNLTAEWQLRPSVAGTPIGALAEVVFTGRTAARSACCGPSDAPGVFRAVKVGTLTGAGLDWSTGQRSFAHFRNVPPDRMLRVGDVVTTAAAHHPRYIGAKVDIVDAMPEGWEGRCIPSGELLVVRLREGVLDPHVLLLWLRSDEGRAALQACVTGQTAHLHPEYVEDVVIPTHVLGADTSEAVGLQARALVRRRESERLAEKSMTSFRAAVDGFSH